MRRIAGVALVAAAAVAAAHAPPGTNPASGHHPAAAAAGQSTAEGAGPRSCRTAGRLPAATATELARRWVAALWTAESAIPRPLPTQLAAATDPALLLRLAAVRPILGVGLPRGRVDVVGAYPDAADPAIVTVAVVDHGGLPGSGMPGATTVVVCPDHGGRPQITGLR